MSAGDRSSRWRSASIVYVIGMLDAACVGYPPPPPSADSSSSSSPSTGDADSSRPETSADASTATSSPPDTTGSSSESSTGPAPARPFQFADNALEEYTQVDRLGFPAVNTGLNLLGDKDEYNQASPVDDAELAFLPNIRASLETLHLGAPMMQVPDNTGLDDDLAALGLTPCNGLPMGSCVTQAGPFVLPDTLEIMLEGDPSFPNGRTLDAPVMDLILAVILLDLSVHDLTTFVDLDADGLPGPSLNPLENDVPFSAAWPYLAPPHR